MYIASPGAILKIYMGRMQIFLTLSMLFAIDTIILEITKIGKWGFYG